MYISAKYAIIKTYSAVKDDDSMKKLRITTVCLLFLATSFIAGCTNNSSSTSPNTDTYSAQEKKVSSVSSESEEISAYNSFTEYDKLTTFEYTEKMLSDMNKDDPDFEIVRNIHEITISGHINSSPVKNEKDTMEQIKLIRSILGLVNPEQQLVFDKDHSSTTTYRFEQYYGGYKVNSSSITAETDDDGFIIYTTSSVISTDILKKTKLDALLSKEDVLAKQTEYKNTEITGSEIRAYGKFSDAPVVAYIGQTDNNTVIFSANDGSIIDIWSDIID